MPEGNLTCAKNGNRHKWYVSNGGKSIYLPKKERFLAEQLAERRYLTLRKKEYKLDLKAIDRYLKCYEKTENKSEKLLIEPSGYRELLANKFKVKAEELLAWQNEEYQHSEKFPEHLKHKTSSGGLVRSKSEVLIDSALYRNKIPYRYECALNLGNYVIYPDFTIRHPITGETYYWEHFGAMDDFNYSNSVFSKLEKYNAHGIILNINLIATYETSEHPLGIDEIDYIIQRYFL